MVFFLVIFHLLCSFSNAAIFYNESDLDVAQQKAKQLAPEIPVGLIKLHQTAEEDGASLSLCDAACGMVLGVPGAKTSKTVISCAHSLESFDYEKPISMYFHMNGKDMKITDHLCYSMCSSIQEDIALFYLEEPIALLAPITLAERQPHNEPLKLFTLSTGLASTLRGAHSLANLDGSKIYFQENTYHFTGDWYEASYKAKKFLTFNYVEQRFSRLEYLASLKPGQSQTFIGDSGSPWLRKNADGNGYELVGITNGASSPSGSMDFDKFSSLVELSKESKTFPYTLYDHPFTLCFTPLPDDIKPISFVNYLTPTTSHIDWILKNIRS